MNTIDRHNNPHHYNTGTMNYTDRSQAYQYEAAFGNDNDHLLNQNNSGQDTTRQYQLDTDV